MRSFFDKTKGSISVFLILILMPMYLGVYLAVDTARYTAAETKTNGAMKLTGNAALADYDESLKKIYGILAMSENEEALVEELTAYFSNMIDAAEIPFMSNLFENAVYTETAKFSGNYVPTSSLVRTDALEDEIRSFMKYRAPLKIAGGMAKKLSVFSEMDKLAEIFKRGTDCKKAISSADSAFTSVFDSFPESSDTDIESVKSSLTEVINMLPSLKDDLKNTSDESESIMDSVSNLEDSEIKELLQAEYGKLSDTLSVKGIDLLINVLKEDLKKLDLLSQNGETTAEIKSNLNYLGNDLYKFLSETYGGSQNSDLENNAESINGNINEIANTGLSEIYKICNDECDYEVSGLVQHSVWKALYSDPDAIGYYSDTDFEKDSSSLDFYIKSFESLSSFFSNVSEKTKEATQNIYEAEYFTEMFACLNTSDTDKNLLEIQYGTRNYILGESEYIIFGKDWMADNITKSLNMIFAIRLLFNSLYAFSDTEIRETAMALANALSGINGFGTLFNQNILIFTWSMAESVTDISKLYKGESVAIYKTSDTWNLDIKNILNYKSEDSVSDDAESKDEGLLSMTYKDYLKLFALIKMCNDDEKVNMLKRAAGIIQINCAQEDVTFDISRCYTKVELESSVCVGMHEIKKTEVYGY